MNITTLNTIGLDGVIIKKGGGSPTPPSGGGGNLSPDAVVYEPNGWCWKWVEGFPSDFASAATMLLGLPIEFGVKYYGGIIKQPKTAIPPIKTLSILSLGVNLGRMQNSADNEGVCIIAVEESKYCSIKVDATTTITANSMYEIINQLQPMTEVEFDSFMRANIGIMRITKEEYESLITA